MSQSPGSFANSPRISLSQSLYLTATLPLQQHMAALRSVMLVICRFTNAYCLLGTLYLAALRPEYLTAFLIMSLPCVLAINYLLRRNVRGLPLCAGICVQHLAVYTLPLLTDNPAIASFPVELLLPAGISFACFIACLIAGRRVLQATVRCGKSKYPLLPNTNLVTFKKRLGMLGINLLAFSLAIQYLFFSGLYWRLGGSAAAALFSAVRVVAVLSAVLGSFLGALTLPSYPAIRIVFAAVWGSLAVLLVSSVLLSSVAGMVLALWVGLVIGGRRIPWPYIIIGITVLAFLNQGKFVMRDRYWNEKNPQRITLAHLPSYYMEWSAASLDKTLIIFSSSEPERENQDVGQSLLSRVNNLHSLLFVTRCLIADDMPSLRGAGYYSLPSVFVPRLLWEGKPRTHEGMVLLNLHFGRQQSIGQTLTTYVAWGLLPEAIGNLGMLMGPIFVGLVLGGLIGMLEVWSAAKMIASIEGIIACTVMLYGLLSFEMTIGVLAAAIFQMMVVVIVAGRLVGSLGR